MCFYNFLGPIIGIQFLEGIKMNFSKNSGHSYPIIIFGGHNAVFGIGKSIDQRI